MQIATTPTFFELFLCRGDIHHTPSIRGMISSLTTDDNSSHDHSRNHGTRVMIGSGSVPERHPGSLSNDPASGLGRGKKRRKTTKDMDVYLINVKVFVKNWLFPRRKFIMKAEEMAFSLESKSICYQCLSFCNMLGEGQNDFWEQWSNTVSSELNARRNHIQNVAKEECMGGCICWEKVQSDSDVV